MKRNRYYLKSGSRETLAALKSGNWQPVEAIEEHNKNILATLYNKLLTGEIKTFYQRTKHNLIIAHKSTRPGVIIQISHLWIRNGELIPSMHTNINCFADLIKHHDFYVSEYIQEGKA